MIIHLVLWLSSDCAAVKRPIAKSALNGVHAVNWHACANHTVIVRLPPLRIAAEAITIASIGKSSAPLRPVGQHRSCALVGSDPSLIGSGCGAEIDQHHAVFRVNSPVIDGFEEDVGNRTTYSVLNEMIIKAICNGSMIVPGKPERTLALRGSSVVYFRFSSRDMRCVAIGLLRANSSETFQVRRSTLKQVTQFMRSFLISVRAKINGRCQISKRVNPSKGMLALVVALSACHAINMYGFRDSTQHRNHYWEPVGSVPFRPAPHNLGYEHQIFDIMSAIHP